MVVFDDTKTWHEKLLLYRNHIAWSNGSIPTAVKNEPETVDVPQEEPLRAECLHFLHCCDHRVTPKTDGKRKKGCAFYKYYKQPKLAF